MSIPEFNEIIEPNDQTEARKEHLEKLRELVGNVYPNKFDRSNITGIEDTISNILKFEPIAEIVREIKAHIATLNAGERPNPELKEQLNAKLKTFGNVRIAGRLAVPPRGLRGNEISMGDLEGRAALITGANRGFGLAIAEAYVDAGADVMLCARDQLE